jgi:tetratricopeptide (TPR) repeat protein
MKKKYFIVLLFLVHASCFSQLTDSLQAVLKTTTEDTAKVKLLNQLFLEYEFSDEAKARQCLDDAITLSKKCGYQKGLARAYKHSGFFAEDKGNYAEALKMYFASLEICEKINDLKGMADGYNGIGAVYFFQKNHPAALKNYFSALKIYGKLGNQRGIGTAYNNIGNVYSQQGMYPEALENLQASLRIDKEINDLTGIAYSLNNIGNVYDNMADLEKDPASFDEMIKQSLQSHFESLKIKEQLSDRVGIASSCGNIGRVYFKNKQFKLSREYLIRAKVTALKIDYKSCLKNSYQSLAELDSAEGNYKGAYENYKQCILYRDSIDNEETRKKTIQSQMTYDFEKKEAVAVAEYKKEIENQQAIASEKSRKQRIIIGAVLAGLILVLAFAAFVFRSLRITRKQKSVIEEQKGVLEIQKQEVEKQKIIVEEKQKEIIDSITYARRIQQSLLPTDKYIESSIKRLKKDKQ